MKIIVQSKIQNVKSYCFNIEQGVERMTSTFDLKLTSMIFIRRLFTRLWVRILFHPKYRCNGIVILPQFIHISCDCKIRKYELSQIRHDKNQSFLMDFITLLILNMYKKSRLSHG